MKESETDIYYEGVADGSADAESMVDGFHTKIDRLKVVLKRLMEKG